MTFTDVIGVEEHALRCAAQLSLGPFCLAYSFLLEQLPIYFNCLSVMKQVLLRSSGC